MLINENKTKNILFNFSKNFQFTTQLILNGKPLETVDKMKILGTIITKDLKWDQNTSEIVKKANARMTLLRKIASFNPPREDLKTIYFLFVRSILEQSAVVWHSSLSKENSIDIERVQKSAVKVILGANYKGYKKSLDILEMQTLEERRKELCLKFAKRCLENPKLKETFPVNKRKHSMQLRKPEKYKIHYAKGERLKRSPIILLNENPKVSLFSFCVVTSEF